MNEKYICVIDIGSTNIRTSIFTDSGQLLDFQKNEISIIQETKYQVEMDPLDLFDKSVKMLKSLFLKFSIDKNNLLSLGISTHRNSFLLWNKVTGVPLSNLICWNDLRSLKCANRWNKSFLIRALKCLVTVVCKVWSPNRLKLLKYLKFKPVHTLVRLNWLIYDQKLITKKELNNSLFGTLETWLVWKLTEGKSHITDLSSVSATCMYDITSDSWNYDLLFFFGIPFTILPEVVKTHGKTLAEVSESIFGFPIKITALIADQQAASVGCGCFESGDVKLTLGTGTFLDITTGNSLIPVIKHNLNPLFGWANDDKNSATYLFEGNIPNTANRINNFLYNENISIKNPEILTDLTYDLENGRTENDLMSIKARDVLESIAFEFYRMWIRLSNIYCVKDILFIKANGGVSNSNYILQCISTLCKIQIRRMKNVESTSVGAMLLARTSHGYDFKDFSFSIDEIFNPQSDEIRLKIINRFIKYDTEK